METPLPIPNRAVKHRSADGTWGATPWESRSPPVFHSDGPVSHLEVAAGLSFSHLGRHEGARAWEGRKGSHAEVGRPRRRTVRRGRQAAQSSSIRGVRSAPIRLTRGIGSVASRGVSFRAEAARCVGGGAAPQEEGRSATPGRRSRQAVEEPLGAGSQHELRARLWAGSSLGRKPYSPRVENSTARSRPSAARFPIFLNTNTGS